MEVGGRRLPVDETVRRSVAAWLAENLPRIQADRDLLVRPVMAPGSDELRQIYADRDRPVVANDTSGASGYAPLSPTEALVLEVERFLNGREFKARFPDTGQDVKVLGVRQDERLALTVAMPLLCEATPSERAYFSRREEILAALGARFGDRPFAIDWALNALDRPGCGAAGAYLSLTGTSAEDGDSGQVGRGNRANGLIAFSRPGGNEAVAGKNPIAHAGKVYSLFGFEMAARLHARCPDLAEVYVHLASRIGHPIDRPWVGIQVRLGAVPALEEIEPALRDVVAASLDDLPDFRARLARGVATGRES
jgi:S-adenosylmethionine synthetase